MTTGDNRATVQPYVSATRLLAVGSLGICCPASLPCVGQCAVSHYSQYNTVLMPDGLDETVLMNKQQQQSGDSTSILGSKRSTSQGTDTQYHQPTAPGRALALRCLCRNCQVSKIAMLHNFHPRTGDLPENNVAAAEVWKTARGRAGPHHRKDEKGGETRHREGKLTLDVVRNQCCLRTPIFLSPVYCASNPYLLQRLLAYTYFLSIARDSITKFSVPTP